MNTAIIETPAAGQLVELGVTETRLAELRKYNGLCAKEDYEAVRLAIADVRSTRTGVDKARKQLNEDAQDHIRRVNDEAKRVTALIVEIEEPLKASKKAVDDEKARIKREKEEAIEAERRAKIEAELAEKKAKEEAERKRVEAAQAAERERLRIENEKLEAEKEKLAEENRIKQEAIDKERAEQEAKLKAERDAIEAERRKVEAEKTRIAEDERKRVEAEEAAKREAEENRLAAERVEAARLEAEARKPDLQKLREWHTNIRETSPTCETEWAKEVVQRMHDALESIAAEAMQEN